MRILNYSWPSLEQRIDAEKQDKNGVMKEKASALIGAHRLRNVSFCSKFILKRVRVENVMPKWDVVQRIVSKHTSHCTFHPLPGDSCSENCIMCTSSCGIRVESTGSLAFTFMRGIQN